jgi:L-lactate dehydrogenase (cytochrome)
VRHAITLLWEEIMRNMAMLGVTDPAQMAPEHLLRLRGSG